MAVRMRQEFAGVDGILDNRLTWLWNKTGIAGEDVIDNRFKREICLFSVHQSSFQSRCVPFCRFEIL